MSDLMGENMSEANVESSIPSLVDDEGSADPALSPDQSESATPAPEAQSESAPEAQSESAVLLPYFQYAGSDADEAALHNYAAAFATTILQRVSGEDRDTAVRKVREALMFACAGLRFGQVAPITYTPPAVVVAAPPAPETPVVVETPAPVPAPAPAPLVVSGTWSGLPDDQRVHLMRHLSFRLHTKRGLLAQAAKRVGVRYQTLHRWLQGVNAPMHTATGDLLLTMLIEQANESVEALLALPSPAMPSKEEAPAAEDAPAVEASEDGAEPSTN